PALSWFNSRSNTGWCRERLDERPASREHPVTRLRVLVADDHKAMRDNLVRMLAREFDVVAAVGDGEAVVAEAERVNPDVLVLDVAMPVMGGIAAADLLKAAGSTAKVVFVTMHHDREFVQESSALG